jgi:SAM-dependent methyltransferase
MASSNPQVSVWNDLVGDAWSTHADHYDTMLAPFGEAVFAVLGIADHERVLDVGCGAGATTVELARRAASAVGADLSTPMLDTARRRAAAAGVPAEFVQVDLETGPVHPAAFDVAFSRFGVMFFTDPVGAFANIRASLVAGGRLGFVCFQQPGNNPFMVVPILSAAAHLPMSPLPGPGEPSPFSLADPVHTTSILTAAGFTDVAIAPGPTSVTLGPAGDVDEVARRALEQNPAVAAGLRAATAEARAAAVAATAVALAPHAVDGAITLPAATWVVSATAP